MRLREKAPGQRPCELKRSEKGPLSDTYVAFNLACALHDEDAEERHVSEVFTNAIESISALKVPPSHGLIMITRPRIQDLRRMQCRDFLQKFGFNIARLGKIGKHG
jgi:hypothetical protein